jgi:tetratricopeptide (TPR) repeat protein
VPDDIGARLGIGIVLFQRGDYANALDSLRMVYPRMDGAPSVALTIAQCMALLKDSGGAAEFLDSEIKTHPKSGALHHIKGDFLVNQRLEGDAVREFVTAYDLDPENTGALLAAAAALMDTRNYDAARKLLTEKLPSAKEPGLVHLALGEILLATNRVDEGAEELRRTLAMSPGHHRALFLLGRVAEIGGQKAEAKRLFREAVQNGSRDAEAFARLAQIVKDEGDRKTAIDLYRSSVTFDPRNARVLNSLANLLAEEDGKLEEALQKAIVATNLDPASPEIADTAGWLYFRTGRVKESSDLLELAAQRLKDNAVVNFHAGMATARLRRTVDAGEYLDRALRLDANFAGADAARAELQKLR